MNLSDNITRHYNWLTQHGELQCTPRYTKVYRAFVKLLAAFGILEIAPNFSMCYPTHHIDFMQSTEDHDWAFASIPDHAHPSLEELLVDALDD